MVVGALKRLQQKNNNYKTVTRNSVPIFCLVAKNNKIACRRPLFFFLIFFKICRLSMFWAMFRLDIFHAMDFGSSEHSEEKAYEIYTLLGLVGARYPSELELPVISEAVGHSEPCY